MTTKVTSNASHGTFGDDERRNADAKKEMLRRIKDAQQLANTPKHVDVPREYHTTSDKSPEELREILIDRLVDYKASVVETTAPARSSRRRANSQSTRCREATASAGTWTRNPRFISSRAVWATQTWASIPATVTWRTWRP